MDRVKLCKVCNNQAIGFSYNAITCLSCKVFFHRNSHRLEELNCNDSNQCTIKSTKRKNCPRCRLEKCFEVGMKRNEPKVESKEKFEESSSTENRIQNRIEILLEISLIKRLTKSDVSDVKHYLTNGTKNQELSLYEGGQIECIQQGIKVFPDESQAILVRHLTCWQECADMMSNVEYYITRTINFCHQIPAFNNLKQEDQLCMLKGFIFTLIQLRFAFMIDLERNGVLMASNKSGTEVVFVDGTIGHPSQYPGEVKRNHEILVTLHHELERDVTIRDLLSVLLLFKEVNDQLSAQEFVRYHYYLYSQLLMRYLTNKYHNQKLAKLKFRALMRVLRRMEDQQEGNRKIVEEFEHVPSVVVEIFDLPINKA